MKLSQINTSPDLCLLSYLNFFCSTCNSSSSRKFLESTVDMPFITIGGLTLGLEAQIGLWSDLMPDLGFSITSGLILGLLFFPSPNFKSSILVGNLIFIDNFSVFIKTNLLLISFCVSLIIPLLIISIYSLRNSFK